MGEGQPRKNFTRSKASNLSTTLHGCLIWIESATSRNWLGIRSGSDNLSIAPPAPSILARQSTVRSGSPKAAEAITYPSRGCIGSVGIDFLVYEAMIRTCLFRRKSTIACMSRLGHKGLVQLYLLSDRVPLRAAPTIKAAPL